MSSPAERYAASRQRAARSRVGSTTPLGTFRASLDFELDDFQVVACQALEDGHGVLVAAPTGAGKTVVGQFAIHLALDQGGKAFYTTPIKALSNQKYADLVRIHGSEQVGLLTGDTTINGVAPIVVMTTEVLRNMLYSGSPTLAGLRFVVMDEVHYLADRFRGPVWEEVIIHLPDSVQLVSLSATVSNAEEIGDWLDLVRGDTTVVVSEERPVPLWQHVVVSAREPRGTPRILDLYARAPRPGRDAVINPALYDALRLDAARTEGPRGKARDRSDKALRRPPADEHPRLQQGPTRHDRPGAMPKRRTPPRFAVIDALDRDELLPAIYFIFSRAGCDGAVQQCLAAGLRLTTPAEEAEIARIAEERTAAIPQEDREVLGYWRWLRSLGHGIAAHHAGLLPVFKETVEELFNRALLKVVFATETLALGINMPARTVALERLTKWDGSSRQPLTPGEYTQFTGRAGRRGIDVEGHAVVVDHPGLDPVALVSLASRRTYPLRSAFRPTYNMSVNLVAQVGYDRGREVLETSLAQFQADRATVELARRYRSQAAALDEMSRALAAAPNRRVERRRTELVAEQSKLSNRIERRTGSIARAFDQTCAVLETLGYLARTRGGAPVVTEDGELLRRIYAENDMLFAQCLRLGVWAELDAPGLAAAVSAVAYSGRTESLGQPRVPGGSRGVLAQALSATTRVWSELTDVEEAHAVEVSEGLDFGLVTPVYRWARGDSLAEVLTEADLSAGDFVRWSKQIIDVLGQLTSAAPTPALRATAQAAADALLRGVVAYSAL